MVSSTPEYVPHPDPVRLQNIRTNCYESFASPKKMIFEDQLATVAIVTADMSHAQIHRAVKEVLQLMRIHLSMDVAFVSKFEGG